METTFQLETNEQFDLAFGFATETAESIFLTGKAGTGKTTFLKHLRQHCAKNIVVAAPTGVAAINAGGVTLHSLFQLPFHPFLPTKASRDELLAKMRFNKTRQQLLRKMEVLVIDEISMVRADTLDAIDCILRSVRRNHHTAFGGVQLLCIGDLFQLPPVARNEEWKLLSEYYASPFFFDSLVVKEQLPLLIELKKIYRQKQDSFVSLLNKVRNNIMSAEDFAMLNSRFIPGFQPPPGENYITLTSHNNQADQINNRELQKLHTKLYSFTADVEGEFPENIFPAESPLQLKEGAQVMFLKNDTIYKRYFNGKIGRVKSVDDDEIIVEADGDQIRVGRETWENTRYAVNRSDGKLEQEVLGTFSQFPLRLAWAITIHKSQGLTFDKLMIDGGLAFASGQVYVALSRCTSLDGIVLLSKLHPQVLFSNDHVVKGQQSLTPKGSLMERFAGARVIFTQQQLEQIFSFSEIETFFNHLLYQVKRFSEKLNAKGIDDLMQLHQQFSTDKSVGEKFIGHIYLLMKEEPVIEKNEGLQKRITDAARHFETKLSSLLQGIKNHTLVTEHKDAANDINDALQELATTVHTVHYLMSYCINPFSLQGYLKHKLALTIPKMNITCYASGKRQAAYDVPNPELFDTLKRWRDMEFETTGFPLYMIASVDSLKALSSYLPLTKTDLAKISGFGKAKVEKYGDEIIEIISDYCERHGLETNMQFNKAPEKKERALNSKPRVDTKKISFDLYKSGNSIGAIAAERKLTTQTIENHLSHFVETGDILIDELVSKEKQSRISEVYAANSELNLTQLKELLPEISFGDLRLVLASLKNNSPQQ